MPNGRLPVNLAMTQDLKSAMLPVPRRIMISVFTFLIAHFRGRRARMFIPKGYPKVNQQWLGDIPTCSPQWREGEKAASKVSKQSSAKDNELDMLLALFLLLRTYNDRPGEALDEANRALKVAREERDKTGEACAPYSNQRGRVMLLNRYDEALATADASLEAARKANSNLAEAYALDNKANSLRMLDRYDEALATADASLEAARKANSNLAAAYALNNKANSLRMLDRHDVALATADASLEAARKAKQQARSGPCAE